jgi:hypothetical protein
MGNDGDESKCAIAATARARAVWRASQTQKKPVAERGPGRVWPPGDAVAARLLAAKG